ncbi:MAG: NAD(P)-dependent alcohol dehydrogenase [Dyadobacter sp.]|uniref:zinc-dependent alcohol dehydrogenase family protein n=1 Tax=Dyadobacter sp. TaxID=1914288 RepID=UPI003265B86B
MTTIAIPSKTKAWRLHGFGINNLKLETIGIPELKPHEVLVKVGAVSLNYRDKAVIDGYMGEILLPLIPVSDAAGVVVQTGSDVTNLNPGDRIISHLWSHWLDGEATPDEYKYLLGSALQGALAQYIVLESQGVVKIPDFFSYEEACTFPTAGLSPWFALMNYGKLKAGDTVLVQGSGGVSVFGIQIAKALGASVIATTSSELKAEKLKYIGADEVVNYNSADWVQETLRLTEGKGVDHLLEVVGGSGLNDSAKAVKHNGQIFIIGFLESQTASFNLITVMSKQIKLQGIAVGHLRALGEMINFFAEKGIKPVIEKIYSFDEVIEAYDHLAKGSLGKIVIRVS